MKNMVWRAGIVIAGILALAFVQARPASAVPAAQDDDPVAHGEYLVSIIGCVDCHSPRDPTTFQIVAGMEFSGGGVFDLGPAGIVLSRNITSDVETGIGGWTDQEIKDAITRGISKREGPDGKQIRLVPVMPYLSFNNMSDEDLDAIVAYIRTLPPVKNDIGPSTQVIPVAQLPPIAERKTGVVAPDPSDTEARGVYLMTAITLCSDCHTPVDPETLAPLIPEKYLAGGNPFEGPWGVVYGGNLTPDEKTGIGTWSEDDIKKVLTTGIRPDGTQVFLMPWFLYANLTPEDLDAVVGFLKALPPIDNEVPAAAFNPEFFAPPETEAPTEAVTEAATEAATKAAVETEAATEEVTATPAAAAATDSTTLYVIGAVVVIVVVVVAYFAMRRPSTPG